MSSLESELRSVSGGDAAEDGSGDVEEREVEVQVGADVHRHHPVEPAEERGRLRVHQDDAHLFINQSITDSQFTRQCRIWTARTNVFTLHATISQFPVFPPLES